MIKNAIRIALASLAISATAVAVPLVVTTVNKKTYELDISEFNNTIVVDGAPVLSSLSIVENRGRKSKVISITDDMIVSCDDTTTVGEKQLVVKYNNQLFTVNFTVKCKVDFVADNKIVNTQYVMDLEEIEFPQGPEKEGCQFVKWHSDNVEVGTNLVYNAVYTVSSSVMPKLSEEYSSIYGKTLESITLPSNSNGYWKFVSETSTPVGNAGKNTFDVEFVPSNSSLIQPAKDVVTINVDKQKVSINVIDDTFTFDGTEKTPIYSTKLADLKVNCVVNNGPAINAGEYTYKLEIDEQNYKGTYYGTLNIEKVYAKIKIADANIDYTTAIPDSFDYVVLDKDGNELAENLVALLGVTTSIPTITDADKVYTITANVNDLENFKVEIENGDLTFNKVEWELDENVKILKYSNEIVYGGVLKNIEFAEYVHGKWYWNEPEFKVLQTGELKTMATFIPNNDNYLKVEREVTLKIVKKKIAIVSEIRDNTYTYNANPHTISYRLLEVESVDDPLTIKVDGVITETDANENGYVTKLVINDERYQGSKDATLVINKGSNSDFANAVVSKEIVYKNQLKLGDVQFVNNCYAWAYPNIQLYTIGKQSFTVKYTPTDTKNYKIEEELVEIEVKRAETLLNVKDCENDLITYTYSASGYDFVERVGANHKESTIVFDYKLNGQTVDCLDCAGTYSVTISLPQTTHYKAQTKTITVVINKVENTQAVKTSVLATYGDLVNNYLPKNDNFGKWSWVDATDTTTVGDATIDVLTPNEEKTRAFNLVYTPTKDYEQNYNSRNLTVNFTVKQKEVKVPVIANKIYNGKNQKSTESELDYNQTLYTIDENNGGTNVNENGYDVKLALRDSKNYVWSGENAGKTQITVTYHIISSETNGWIYTPTMSKTWKYSETPSVVAGSVYGEYKILFKLKDSTNEFAKFELNKAKTYNVGKYIAKFVVEQDEYKNYNGLETAEFDFEITYFEVDVPAVTNSGVTYTGSNIKARIATSDYYTISNDTYKNAGKYKVKLTLNNDNYKWKNDETRVATKQLDFEIKQIENKQVVATEVVATYGDLINKYLPKNDGYGVWKWMFGGEYVTETTTVGNATVDVLNPDKVETRTFKLVYNPTSEFEQNCAGRTINVKFVVKQAIVEVPTIKNKVFNNAMQYPTQDELDYDQTLYTIVQNNGGINVGEYSVVLSLNNANNYVWIDKYAGLTEITLTYKIVSSTKNEWLDKPTITKRWKYGEKATANASSQYGEYKIMYKPYGAEDTEYVDFDVEKSNVYGVGKYTAIFIVENEDVDNFNELVSEEFDFEIIYYEVEIPEVENTGVTYNTQEQTADIITSSYYTILNNKYTNAGIHKVTLTLTNDNYKWKNDDARVATKQLDFVINKVENTQTVATMQTATYGDLLSEYLPLSNTYGSWSWQTTETTVGNATTSIVNNTSATRTFVAVYTPYEDYKQNYAIRTVSVVFTVNQKEVTVPTIKKVAYNGKTQSPLSAEIDRNSTIYEVNQDVNESQAGTYEVVLQLRDADNYCWNSNNLSPNAGYLSEDISIVNIYYTIGTSTNIWKTAPSISNEWIYSQTALVSGKAGFGDYRIEFKVKDALDSTYKTFEVSKSNTYGVGNYTARFVVPASYSSTNSELLNYNGLTSEEFDFEIKYLEIDKPAATNSTHTYSGAANSATIEESSYYSITGNSRVNAGSQTITIALTNANCKWKNGARENLTYTLTVDPATNTWNSTPQNISITYGGSYTPSASAKFGSASVVYSSDGGKTYGTTKPTNAGSYNIKYTVPAMAVDGNTNYDEISYVVDLTIAKANITLGGYNLTDKPYYENSAVATLNSKLTATGVNGVNLKTAGTFTIDGSLVLKTTNPKTSQTYETISYNVTFTPNAAILANYNAPSAVSGSINLNRVAYIGSTYYGSIENALAEVVNATSATTVMVIPNASGDVTIASNVTIGSKVTLALPYLSAADNATHVVNSNFEATLCNQTDDQVVSNNVKMENVTSDFAQQKLTNKVVVLRGVTVTNKGVLKIAGEISCGSSNTGVVGNTARNFAEIELQDGVKLSDGTIVEGAKIVSENGSTIIAFGYIDADLTSTNTSLPGIVTLNSGSHLDIPFIVNDMCGGRYMTGCYTGEIVSIGWSGIVMGKKITPFRQFELRNVVTNMVINYGATVMGHANVFGDSVTNYASAKLIGLDDTYLINLSAGAKLECKYESLDRLSRGVTDKVNNVWFYGKNHFTFKGGATSNALSLTLLSQKVETKDVPFPISWHQNITLANLDDETGAQYTMNYGYKILQGGMLTVNSGVELTVGSISVYEKDQFIDGESVTEEFPVYAARYGFYQNGQSMNLDEGKLIVNGTLKVETAIGGKVSSTINGAKIQPKNTSYSASCTTYEVKIFVNTNALNRKIKEKHTFNKSLQLVKADGSTITGSSNKTYTYNGTTWA